MRTLACLALAACFHPDLLAGDPCAADDHDWCPPPLTCSNHVCVLAVGPSDANGGDAIVRTANVAFVTRDPMALPLQSTPAAALDEADKRCNDAAVAAHLDGHFIAWLSTATTNALDRIANHRGWVRPDNAPFVDSTEDIKLGKIYYPLDIDEYGNRIDFDTTAHHIDDLFLVATGTTGLGKAQTTPDETCTSFSTMTGVVLAGSAMATAFEWTDLIGNTSCGASLRLYCFQDAFLTALTPPTPDPTAKLAFVSTSMFGSGGVAAADAVCNADGNATGHMFTALIADDGIAPATRITHPGPWKRKDGVQVTSDLQYLDAPINQQVDGTYLSDIVWTGTTSLTSPGTTSSTCAGWTSGVGQGRIDATGLMSLQYPGPTILCGSGLRVWCMEDD
jgi:hypothetical protein